MPPRALRGGPWRGAPATSDGKDWVGAALAGTPARAVPLQAGRGAKPPHRPVHAHRAHRALEQAVRWGLVPRNVSEAVDPPRARREEARPRRGARPPRSPLRARPHHRHETGRASGPEVGGHRDLERGVIRVRRTLAGAREGVPAFETPKTAKSRRSVPLTPGAIEALKRHRKRQLEEKLRRAAWRDCGLVFTTEAGTPLDRHNRFWATPASRSTPTPTSCPAWAKASPPRWSGRSAGPAIVRRPRLRAGASPFSRDLRDCLQRARQDSNLRPRDS